MEGLVHDEGDCVVAGGDGAQWGGCTTGAFEAQGDTGGAVDDPADTGCDVCGKSAVKQAGAQEELVGRGRGERTRAGAHTEERDE